MHRRTLLCTLHYFLETSTTARYSATTLQAFRKAQSMARRLQDCFRTKDIQATCMHTYMKAECFSCFLMLSVASHHVIYVTRLHITCSMASHHAAHQSHIGLTSDLACCRVVCVRVHWALMLCPRLLLPRRERWAR